MVTTLAFGMRNGLVMNASRCPRGGSEECQWQKFTQLLSSVVLSSANDRCSWSLNGNDVFSVKSAREVIDKHINSRLESTYPTEVRGVECTLVKVSLIPSGQRCGGQGQRPLRGQGAEALAGSR
ncbi:hypothetical protein Tco_0868883 [Tanacetum coccineum]